MESSDRRFQGFEFLVLRIVYGQYEDVIRIGFRGAVLFDACLKLPDWLQMGVAGGIFARMPGGRGLFRPLRV